MIRAQLRSITLQAKSTFYGTKDLSEGKGIWALQTSGRLESAQQRKGNSRRKPQRSLQRASGDQRSSGFKHWILKAEVSVGWDWRDRSEITQALETSYGLWRITKWSAVEEQEGGVHSLLCKHWLLCGKQVLWRLMWETSWCGRRKGGNREKYSYSKLGPDGTLWKG